MSDQKDEILAGLEPMFAKAKAEGLWFFCSYQSLWFSPKELRAEHVKGKFIWGAVNWELRNPRIRLNELDRKRGDIAAEIARFAERVEESR